MTNDNYAAELSAAQRNFAARTKGLDPRLLRLQMIADTHKPSGFHVGQIDPLERSFAKQTLETIEARDELARLEKAHADLTATRNPRQTEADRLVALKSLADRHDLFKIKLLRAAQEDHTLAAQEAREAYAVRDADVAQTVAIRAAATARAEAAMMDSHPAVAALAAAIVAKRQAI